MLRLSADIGEITIPIPHIIIMHTPSRFGLKLVVESKLLITEMVMTGCTPKMDIMVETIMKIAPISGVNSGTDKAISPLVM